MKIGLGGGCHWCTEAVFQALRGVTRVEQGYISEKATINEYSEAIIVHYNENLISLEKLIEIHLYTHNSTSNHSMRNKYKSAIYCYDTTQSKEAKRILELLQSDFNKELITKVLDFGKFKASRQEILNYYLNGPERPFCKKYIEPKLKLLLAEFSDQLDI